LRLYCLAFGTLLCSIMLGAYGIFCRPRARAAGVAPPIPEPIEPQAPRSSQPDRVSAAIRNWSSERAEQDLYVPEVPAPVAPELAPAPAPEEPEIASAIPQRAAQIISCDEPCGHTPPPAMFVRSEFEDAPNYYDVLQISPRADLDTIHRVYRIMAARFHPDNPQSGDHERFLKLGQAYEVLADAARRAQYDSMLRIYEKRPLPIFGLRVFVDGLEGEINRRLGVLSLLYQRCRGSEVSPGLSVLELEARMALPREHLEFTLWYLRSKRFVQITEDNSDYALTAEGVDFVEQHSSTNHIVRELLAPRSGAMQAPRARKRRTHAVRT